MTFAIKFLEWKNKSAAYVKQHFVPLEKIQLNMKIPEILRDEILEFVDKRRTEIVSDYEKNEKRRLATEFEQTNPPPRNS